MVIYTVQKGDSLYSIARTYGTTADRIAADNDLDSLRNLTVGQTLVILQPLITYRVRAGDSVYSIANQFGISLNQLWRNNPSLRGGETIIPGQLLNIVLPETKFDKEIDVNGYVYPNVSEEVLRRTLPYLTYLTIFTYGIADDGSLVDVDDEGIIQLARSYGVAPLMQISSLNERGVFSSATAARLFSDPVLQDRVIAEIEGVLREKRYSGVDVDFEYVEGEYADAYVEFVRKLREALAPDGYEVFVALAPKYEADQEGLLYEGHDYRGLGEAADAALIMAYEWGYRFGEPQAVAPIDKVRRVMDYAVTEIPPEKLFLGTPNYGYDWPLPFVQGATEASSLSNQEAIERATEKKAAIEFDPIAKSPYYNYFERTTGRPVEHVVWFEDGRSVDATMDVVNDYGIRGVTVWNLMRYFPQLWTVLNSTFRIRRGLQ